MKRTTIALPDQLAAALDREARRRRTSVSQVVRTALTEQLGMDADRPRDLPFAAIGRSGQSSTGRDMEELLEREWRELPRSR